MRSTPSRSRPSVAAFTLLEVLVASAVLTVMMTILLTSVSTSLSLWRTTENKISADREGRSAHLLLAQDLASAVVPTNTNGPATNLWPQITKNGSNLGFLTIKSADYQDPAAGDVGDVCYVEYEVRADPTNANAVRVFRRFASSKETYESLKNSQMPTNTTNVAQMLADNIIANTNALRGTPIMKTSGDVDAIRTNFVAVRFTNSGNSILYAPAGTGRPDAIEVNLSAADMEAARDPDLRSQTNRQIRSAGFYTFRVNLPK